MPVPMPTEPAVPRSQRIPAVNPSHGRLDAGFTEPAPKKVRYSQSFVRGETVRDERP